MYGYGVDIGGTAIKFGFFHSEGGLIEKWEIPSRREGFGEAILSDISQAICDNMQKKQLALTEIKGIGVGVPGPVTERGEVGVITNIEWKNRDIAGELGRLTGLPVYVENDANAAVLGEWKYGVGKGTRSMVMLTLGTGVGGGVVVDGKLIHGVNGAAGEVGHICVNSEEKEVCGCGKRGCLEQYASATGMVRLMKKRMQAKAIAGPSEITAKEIWDFVKAGDEDALFVADEVSRYLGMALSNIAVMTDPELLVLGGGVSKAGEILLNKVIDAYQEQTFHACRATPLKLAELGNDAGIYGCMGLIF